MATTRLIAMHVGKGQGAGGSMASRVDYATNPEKTENGQLVTGFACDPKTAANEFELMRKAYLRITGRDRKGEVIAYQLRQSFKPGEVTPEEANQIGNELASRFLKGNHAYIVATHTDKAHIHNHIIFCATTLDCKHKFRNFLGSGKALARLSDQICMEHKLSVVSNPRMHDTNYDRWQGNQAKLSTRDHLRLAIDEILQKRPDGFEALIRMLEEAGWKVKRGKQPSFCAPDGKRYIRMDSLGEAYTEKAIREVLDGLRVHNPYKTRRMKSQVSLLIDIQAKMQEGKGKGYENWAKVFNIKQMASSMSYMTNHGIKTYDELSARVYEAVKKTDTLLEEVKAAEARLKEINSQRKTILDYMKTKDVYNAWKKTGFVGDFYAAHEQEIIIHQAAKKAFNEFQGKIPSIKSLSAEYKEVLAKKQKAYAEYREARDNMRELLTVKANVDMVTERRVPVRNTRDKEISR